MPFAVAPLTAATATVEQPRLPPGSIPRIAPDFSRRRSALAKAPAAGNPAVGRTPHWPPSRQWRAPFRSHPLSSGGMFNALPDTAPCQKPRFPPRLHLAAHLGALRHSSSTPSHSPSGPSFCFPGLPATTAFHHSIIDAATAHKLEDSQSPTFSPPGPYFHITCSSAFVSNYRDDARQIPQPYSCLQKLGEQPRQIPHQALELPKVLAIFPRHYTFHNLD